ncbi:glycoside hydrolase family 3 N-terminal domain-containing protein [Pseudochryseolinea flava]|uniref:Periplasmic beta-glucosidase n=1 Tax=Pseudochryseolinea flava TaxID=2059302 RepID=A0A364Y3F1_9BACT|nr:glycoside hydrolase family 3 N-terminal domain-containing protein [Pseudochryseolinea flava]RAW00676.1 glycosyl hydrolase [Pseudochryseolinea flava]
MKRLAFLFVVIVAMMLSGCGSKTEHEQSDNISHQVDSVLQLMTLEEKIGQLTLYTSDYDVTGPSIRENYKDDIKKGRVGAIFNAFGADYTRKLQEIAVKETRLGIPLLFGYDVIHGHRTIFPIPLGETASWDTDAAYTSSRIAAVEASAEGLHWTFAPMCDIARDPRWGRMAEGAGEDTYLGVKMAEARVRGFQGNKLGDLNSVMACVKHFAAYGAVQAGRDYHTVDMSDRMLREVYLPPYKAALDAGAATVMTSFNEYDGVPASGSKFLMTDLLRNEWKFDGFVVTDYTSIMEMIPHGAAEDTASAAALAIEAGVDMDMQAGFYEAALPALVKSGKIKEHIIDAAVRRILRKKFELGLFKDPYRYSDVAREKSSVMTADHLNAARDIARKSFVLLKNDGQVLPLSKTGKRIALIGPLVNNKREMIGSWSAAGDGQKSISVLEGIRQAIPGVQINYAKGCNINDDSTRYFSEAVRAASQSDVVVMALGEAALMSGEAASRADLNLPGVQQKLFDEIKKTGKPIVVVLFSGRPLTINSLDKNADAILEVWFPGTQAGLAIADVLFGDYNPSGKLPVTFPRSVGQIPIFYSMKNTGRPMDPNQKYTSKYLDESNEPLYPFGYGLSYTTFNYGDVSLNTNEMQEGDTLVASCSVSNAGKATGEEVVQLYVRDQVGSVTRPVKELKGFQKIVLKPGESKVLTFKLSVKDLSFYRRDMTWGTEPGKFDVFIGSNSRDAKSTTFVLK